MKNFEIVGYFKYANIRDTVPAASQKDALIQVLKKYDCCRKPEVLGF